MAKTPAGIASDATLQVKGFTLQSIGPSKAGAPRYANKSEEVVVIEGRTYKLYSSITAYEQGSEVKKTVTPKPSKTFDSSKVTASPNAVASLQSQMDELKALILASVKPAVVAGK